MKSNSAEPRGRVGNVTHVLLVVCLLVFALFLKASYGVAEASSYLLPRAIAIAGIVVTSIELLRSYVRRREENDAGAERKGVHVVSAIGFAAVYFALVPLLGFVLSTAISIAAFGILTRFPRRKLIALLAVVVPIVLHLTFVELLKAPLPGGVFGALPF